jgi:hypothetical protein
MCATEDGCAAPVPGRTHAGGVVALGPHGHARGGGSVIEAVRSYLALLRSPFAGDRLAALAAALDQLACAYHATSEAAGEDGPDPPDSATYEKMRELAAAAFPDFGFYAAVRPGGGPEQLPTMGDAIDDLADIALELTRIERLWVDGRPLDAERNYRFGYRIHWGRHLHDLRGYLHARQFER